MNGKLEVHWEVEENIDKAKASLDFILNGCKCKTGCTTQRCSCRKKERECGPSCSCQFCNNLNKHGQSSTSSQETDLVVQEMLGENTDDTYVDESEDDLEEWRSEEMDADEELKTLMEFVFGPESDQEDQ